MPALRPRPAAVVLALVAVVVALLAVRSGSTPPHSGKAGPAARTPVLSARRVPALLVAAQGDPGLIDAVAGIVADGPADTCVAVDVDGRTVYQHQSDLPVAPASNQKLLTAALALDLLGANHRYETTVVGPKLQGDTIAGDLTLVGGGDPVLGTKDYAAHFAEQPAVVTSLESLADSVVRAGVKHVTGSIRGDESRYDSLRVVPSWPDRYLDQRQLGPLSGLTVNGNLAEFPAVETEDNRTDVTLAEDPPAFAAEKFAAALRERGVRVDGGAVAGRAAKGEAVVAKVTSPPMTDIVRHMLSDSDNQIAELLVKEIGVEKGSGGTTADGLTVMRHAIDGLGVPTDGVKIFDGSGLDRNDRLTCSIITSLLRSTGQSSAVGRGLAVAGRSGTLRDRFMTGPVKGRLKAKTGTLNDVTALSGYADSLAGVELTFAYVATGEIVGPQLMSLQDRLGTALVEYAGALRLEQLGPR